MLVDVENEILLKLLIERVKFWTDDQDVIDLYESMYDNYLENGMFSEKFDVDEIVDNDYVNYCNVISEGDEDFEKVQNLAKNYEYDISCQTCYSYVEAHNDDYSLILVRH